MLVRMVLKANGGALLAPLVRYVWPICVAMTCVIFIMAPNHNRHIYGLSSEFIAELSFALAAVLHIWIAFKPQRVAAIATGFVAMEWVLMGRAIDIWLWNNSQATNRLLAGSIYAVLSLASLIILLVQVGLALAGRLGGDAN